MVTSVKTAWLYLTGSPSEFSLESRIFHSLSLIGLIAIVYHIPFNLILGLHLSAITAFVLLILQSGLYYLSRFKKKLQASIILTGIFLHILLVINFIGNAGLEGPSLMLLVLAFFLIITVASTKTNVIWIVVNILVMAGLLITEYYFPGLIVDAYPTREDVFVSTASVYIVSIALIYAGTFYIRNSYKQEKISAELKAVSMERLNDEKDKLFSIISHDLRSPLATIHDYLQILSEEDLDPADKRNFETELLQITRNTQDMLTNILTWSTSQMEGLHAKIQEVNVLKTLRSTLNVQRAIASKKDLKLSYQIDPSLQILADPDMLQVIIRNLINNAIKFTRPGGQITVECRVLKTTCLFMISDTGIGMSADKLREIFSLRAHSTYGTENEKGVGLGLLLCKEFSAAQNASIWVESVENEGSSFFISFPANENSIKSATQTELFSIS